MLRVDRSARIDVHEFCLQDETPVQDATLLSSYLTNMVRPYCKKNEKRINLDLEGIGP